MGFAEKDRILGFYQVSYQLYKLKARNRWWGEKEMEIGKWRLKKVVFLDNLNSYFEKNKNLHKIIDKKLKWCVRISSIVKEV